MQQTVIMSLTAVFPA